LAEPGVAQVQEYIKKYNLEDELSHAVNLAIKENSDDPFKVISEYTKGLSKGAGDEDEDEDEDEVVTEEQEMKMPVLKGRKRHEQVMAAAVEVPAGWTPPAYEKTDSEAAFLKETIETNRLMKNLEPSDREQLGKAFQKVSFAKGDFIIKQGDKGDNFYILDEGECDISVEGKGSVMTATKGIAFGELALLHNAPRAATVQCTSAACTAWSLDMLSFKTILMGKSQTDSADYEQFLENVPLLSQLSKTDKQTLASSLKEVEYEAGRNIICEGDAGDNFYLIRSGEVKCTKVGSADEVSRRLKKGDFFGELALLSTDKRAATVSSVEKTTVLTLGRVQFTRLLGPLKDIMAAADQGRK
jgi:cAMP-dependent protein kinase regulator